MISFSRSVRSPVKRLMQLVKQFVRDEEAPTLMEYGLLVILIAFVAIIGVTALGSAVNSLFQDGAAGFP